MRDSRIGSVAAGAKGSQDIGVRHACQTRSADLFKAVWRKSGSIEHTCEPSRYGECLGTAGVTDIGSQSESYPVMNPSSACGAWCKDYFRWVLGPLH